ILARIVAKEMSRQINQSIVVENRSGAAGAIAAEHVARSPADGYSLLVGSAGIMAIAPHLVPVTGVSLPYKRADFVPVVLFASLPNVFVVSKSSPIQSIADLITAAKEQP